jgi:thiamine biosynthesis lipoprotein
VTVESPTVRRTSPAGTRTRSQESRGPGSESRTTSCAPAVRGGASAVTIDMAIDMSSAIKAAVARPDAATPAKFPAMRAGMDVVWWLIGLGGALLNLQPRPAHAQGSLHEFREAHLGMEMRIALVHASADTAAALARRAFDEVERLEALLSDWRPRSEVRRLELAPPGAWVPVSAALTEVLALSLAVARASHGAFDPTVGPLTALWREARRTGRAIDEEERQEARSRVGHGHVELDSAGGRVRFAVANVRLDLGAVAKGWILDRALAVLVRSGGRVDGALVEAGGDVAVHGAPPGARGWRIEVPRDGGDTVLVLNAGAVSTSGPDSQRAEGESHVLDARTGRGGQREGRVTVTGASAAVTDALATALSLVAPSERARLAARFGVTVVAPRS